MTNLEAYLVTHESSLDILHECPLTFAGFRDAVMWAAVHAQLDMGAILVEKRTATSDPQITRVIRITGKAD